MVVSHAWGRDLPAETTDETQQLIDRYVAQLAAADIPATGEVHEALDKGIGDALIDVAKSHQAGLIVLGQDLALRDWIAIGLVVIASAGASTLAQEAPVPG